MTKTTLEPSVNSINSFQTFPHGTDHPPSHLMCYEMVSITMWSVEIFWFCCRRAQKPEVWVASPKRIEIEQIFLQCPPTVWEIYHMKLQGGLGTIGNAALEMLTELQRVFVGFSSQEPPRS